jgi:O-antigen ligase
MAIGITFVLFAVLASCSIRHSVGFWLFLMITHGIFYQYLGEGSEHIPLVGGVAILIAIAVLRKWRLVALTDFGLVMALVIAMVLAGMFGVDQENSLAHLMIYARGFILVLLLAGTLHEDRDIRLMTYYCLAGLVLGVLFTVFQKITGTFTISTIYEQRAAGLRGDPNDTAMLLVAGIPLALYHMFATRNLALKVLHVMALVTLLAGIILTGSRGGFVALLLVMALVFLRRPSFRVFFAGMFLVVVFVALAPQSYWERMETLITGHEAHLGQSLQNRARLQKIGVGIFLDYPLLGIGPGNFSAVFLERFSPSSGGIAAKIALKPDQTYAVAHNMYLEFLIENGFIGGGVLLAVFFRSCQGLLIFDRSRGVRRGELGMGFAVLLALAGMLFSGLFLSQAKNSVLWFVTGIGFAAGMIARKQVKTGEAELVVVPTGLPKGISL